jgi:CHAT domain-containing protein
MGQFYRRVLMRGMPAGRMLAATSLQEAQVFMYEKLLAHPHYWAAFELHGDWR